MKFFKVDNMKRSFCYSDSGAKLGREIIENVCIQYDVCKFSLKVSVIYREAKIGIDAPQPAKGRVGYFKSRPKISTLMALALQSLEYCTCETHRRR